MRLDELNARAVAPAELGVGSLVEVRTRMGAVVAEGAAAYPTAHGTCVGGRFFDGALYLFLPKETHARAPLDEAKAKERRGKSKLGPLDPEALPDDVRLAVTVDHDLNEEDVQRVLASIGDAALQALKGVGMREDEVYARVAAVLKAVENCLVAKEGAAEDAAAAKARVDAASKVKRKASGTDADDEE
jgi:hypothetical protein